MSDGDSDLLAAISRELTASPFAASVSVFGQRISRPIARAMERNLLRERRNARPRHPSTFSESAVHGV